MIPVVAQPEPADFVKKVKQLGEKFLNSDPKPTSWDNKEYWRKIIPELTEIYNHFCAYSGMRIFAPTGDSTVDHFIPRQEAPELAYDWTNFRLSCRYLNSVKGTSLDVVDPFSLKPNWFVLDFPSLLVKAGDNLTDIQLYYVERTISVLKLNESYCLNGRIHWVMNGICRGVPIQPFKEFAPFIGYELERQGLLNSISEIMGLH